MKSGKLDDKPVLTHRTVGPGPKTEAPIADPAAITPALVGADGRTVKAKQAKKTIGVEDAPLKTKGHRSVAVRMLDVGQDLLGKTTNALKKGLTVALLGISLLAATGVANAQDTTTTPQATVSPQLALLQQLTLSQTVADKPTFQLTSEHAQRHNSSEITFTVPSAMRSVKDGQSVLVPLEAGRTLHMIELRYQDTRALKDLELNRRAPGSTTWETFRGDEYRTSVDQEKAGTLEIKREPDHNSAWINNPIRVRVDVVDAEGNVLHAVGKKFLDFHIHDAWSADGSGSPETDNISNSYESLPQGKLPPGAQLKLTPVHEHKKPWEADRTVAMDLSWVKPIYMPEFTASEMVRTGGWEKPSADGYTVEAGRPISAVFVKWTDHGGTASGTVKLQTADGTFRSSSYNVGSGETELIPLDGVVSKDGKLHIEGYGLEVGDIKVLYK